MPVRDVGMLLSCLAITHFTRTDIYLLLLFSLSIPEKLLRYRYPKLCLLKKRPGFLFNIELELEKVRNILHGLTGRFLVEV